MIVQLYLSDERYLPVREVASRLVQFLPTVRVDWDRGNRMIEESLQRLVEQETPDVFLQSHRALFDNTAFIEFWLPEYPGESASAVLHPYDSFFLEPSGKASEQFLLSLGHKVAEALGYSLTVR